MINKINIVKYLDFLSSPPALKINQQPCYQTYFGGIISLIIFSCTIVGVVYFGSELFTKIEPVAIISAKDFDTLEFNIAPLDYSIYIAIEDKNYVYYNDPTIFSITAYNDVITISQEGIQNTTRQSIEIKTCSLLFDDKAVLQNNQTNLDLNMFYCIKPNQCKIKGFWGSSFNSYVGIVLSKCVNSTENKNFCKSIEVIENKLQGGVIDIYSENHILDLNDYNYPVKRFFTNVFNSLNIDLTFSLFIPLRRLDFISDGGFILKDEMSIMTSYFEEPHILYYGRRDEVIADILIQGEHLGMKIARTYTKFQDVLTKVGGLIKALTVIGRLIINYTSEIEFINDYIFNIKCRERVIGFESEKNFIKKDKSESLAMKKNLGVKNSNSAKANELDLDSILSKKQATPILNQNYLHHLNKANTNHYQTIAESNIKYKLISALHDFIKQALCFWRHTVEHQIFRSFQKKICHSLSVETLIEKMFLLELLDLSAFSADQRRINSLAYIKSIKKESKGEAGNVFDLDIY